MTNLLQPHALSDAEHFLELARNVLDISLRFPVIGALAGRLDARNLLDEPFKSVQGTVTRESWTVGRTFQLGFTFRP